MVRVEASNTMKSVYISATYKDLRDHREAVTHALRKMGYEVHCMEDYVATDERTDERCVQDVNTCDFYIAILAQRYGWISPGNERSITEMEYRQAKSQGPRTRCLVFLLHADASWPQRWIDALHDPAAANKLECLKRELTGTATGVFSSIDDLVPEVMAAVHMEDSKNWKLALQEQFEACLRQSLVEPLSAPEFLANEAYKLHLASSEVPAIIGVLQTAIQNADTAKLVGIDLGSAGGWWSTRLLLLASILEGYTNVSKLVFSNNGDYVGLCGLADTRRAIGKAFPDIAKAISECIPESRGFDPASDIPEIVTQFSMRLMDMGGEESLKTAVLPHVVRNFLGFNKNLIQFHLIPNASDRQREVLRQPHQYVAVRLEVADPRIAIVDRLLFASRVAELALQRV
jgi:Domain of unknown function (DUF4062)